MFDVELNSGFLVDQSNILEHALSTNPDTQKAMRKLIRKVILDARSEMVSNVEFKHGDPRGAARSIRTTIYKQLLGANINIYNSRKAHGSTNYEPPRKGLPNRGGNRRTRSPRTAQIMSYDALDRGFILRWINDGANDRSINFRRNNRRKEDKWNKHPNTGNRGSIAPRHWFKTVGNPAMAKAVDNLSNLIDEELEIMLNKKK